LATNEAKKVSWAKIRAWRVVILVAGLSLWEVATRRAWIDPFFVSQPTVLAAQIADWIRSGFIFRHLLVTIEDGDPALADPRRGMDLDSGDGSADRGNRPRERRDPGAIEGARQAVGEERVNPGPSRQDLQLADPAGGRIAAAGGRHGAADLAEDAAGQTHPDSVASIEREEGGLGASQDRRLDSRYTGLRPGRDPPVPERAGC